MPGKEKVLKHLRGIKAYLGTNRQAPAGKVIGDLNPVIRGWANHYRYCGPRRRSPKSGIDSGRCSGAGRNAATRGISSRWVKRRYFRNDGYWTFYAGEWNLFKPDSTPITRYTKVIGKHSPYDPTLRPVLGGTQCQAGDHGDLLDRTPGLASATGIQMRPVQSAVRPR